MTAPALPALFANIEAMTKRVIENRHTPDIHYNYAVQVQQLLQLLNREGFSMEFAPVLPNGMVLDGCAEADLVHIQEQVEGTKMEVASRLVTAWEVK